MVFIPKMGRINHNTAKDYRPISLSSFLLKTLERLIDLHIRNVLITNNTYSKAQHAYQKGRSVETALHSVVGNIEYSLHHKMYTLAAFLDIEGAFNNVKTESIVSAMEQFELCPSVIKWIKHMLEKRVINATMGDTTVRKITTRGTPQGGVLSPLLWNLVVNDILTKLNHGGIKMIAYADDVVIMITGKFLSTISDLMQTALLTMAKWATHNGLGVNPSKTDLIPFTRKYKIPSFKLPKMDGTELTLSTEAKYLGVILDSKLSWKRNTEERMKKALSAFYTCKRLFGKTWGSPPHIIYWMYKAIVRPILTYGALVWWETTRTQSRLKLLSKVQRLACINITGAIRSTPQMGLEMILGIEPIDKYIQTLAAKSATRLWAANMLTMRNYGHSSIHKDAKITSNNKTDYLIPTMDFNISHKTLNPDRQDWKNSIPIKDNELKI